MSTTRIAEIRAREQAATPGHWGTQYDGKGTYSISAGLRPTPAGTVRDALVAEVRSGHGDSQAYHDARFIAEAREDLAFLLDRVAELEEALAEASKPGRPVPERQPRSTGPRPLAAYELADREPCWRCGEPPVEGTHAWDDRGDFQLLSVHTFKCAAGHGWRNSTDGG